MFSQRERDDMKNAPIAPWPNTSDNVVSAKLRRFYTYWALKEAYIKMVGDGLLASWLRELEFTDVTAPPASLALAEDGEGERWGLPSPAAQVETDVKIWFRGESVKDVKMKLTPFQDIFILATAIRGVVEKPLSNGSMNWKEVDIERDVRPCAEGRCNCLNGKEYKLPVSE